VRAVEAEWGKEKGGMFTSVPLGHCCRVERGLHIGRRGGSI